MNSQKISTMIGIGAQLSSGFTTTFSQFDSRLATAAKNARQTNDSLKNISGLKKLEAELPAATDKITGAELKLKKLREEYAQTGNSSEALRLKIIDQENRVESLTTRYDNQVAEITRLRSSLTASGVDITKMASEEKRLEAAAAAATAKLKAMSEVKSSLSKVKSGLSDVKSAAVAAGASILAVGFTLKKLIWDSAEAGDEAAKTAAALGMSSQELQKWQYVGIHAGVSADKMTHALTTLNQKIEDARQGSGKAADVFGELNLDPESLGLMSTSDRLQTIGDAINGYAGTMNKTSMVMAIFGNYAYRMSGLLNMSAEEQKKLADEAERTGYAFTAQGAKAAEAFQDATASFEAATTGVRNQIATKLMPPISSFLNFMSRHTWALKLAFAAVAAVIGVACVVSVAKLGLTTVSTLKDVGALVKSMRALGAIQLASGGKAGFFTALSSGAKGAVGWVVKLVATFIPMLISAATTASATITAAIGAIPIVGWIALAITAAIALGVIIYKYWTPIKKFFASIWSGFVSGLKWAFELGRKIFTGYIDIVKKVGSVILDVLLAPIRAVVDAWKWLTGQSDKKGSQNSLDARRSSVNNNSRVLTGATQSLPSRMRVNRANPSQIRPSTGSMAGGANNVQAVANSPIAGTTNASSSTSISESNEFHIHALPGQSPDQIADAVVRKMDARTRRRRQNSLVDTTLATAGGVE